MSAKRGFTLLEILVGLLLMMLVGLVAFKAYGTVLQVGDRVGYQSHSNARVRLALDTMADHLRNAQLCKDGSAGILNSVLDQGTGSSITYYTDDVGGKVRYFLQATELQRTADGVTTTVVRGVQGFTLRYQKTGLYNGTWVSTIDPTAPAAGEMPYVVAVTIRAQVLVQGIPTAQTTIVRLRNSPRKAGV